MHSKNLAKAEYDQNNRACKIIVMSPAISEIRKISGQNIF
jgi:hypothetical protein